MEILIEVGKLVLAMTVISGGVVAIGKTKFLTKKEFKEQRNSCQEEMTDLIKTVHADQKAMSLKQAEDMEDIKEFMGKVNYHIQLRNGGS